MVAWLVLIFTEVQHQCFGSLTYLDFQVMFLMSLIVGVDDYSSESDVIIIPSALDFVSQDEMLTPLGRLDKYAASENIFNRYVPKS